jgi:hypothetical protein
MANINETFNNNLNLGQIPKVEIEEYITPNGLRYRRPRHPDDHRNIRPPSSPEEAIDMLADIERVHDSRMRYMVGIMDDQEIKIRELKIEINELKRKLKEKKNYTRVITVSKKGRSG